MNKDEKELDENLDNENENASDGSCDKASENENSQEDVKNAEVSGEACDETSDKADEVIDKTLELEKKAADYLDRYQRTLAEFDNFRKRTSKEKASMYDDGVRDTVQKLIPVVDNFERAVLATSDADKEGSLYKGMEMVLKQFTEILTSMGVEEIKAQGEAFDPNLHNAVMHIEDENLGENVVANVLQKGYICKDKVIRPSMVQVAN